MANPFDDDVDDFVFLSKAKGSSASPWSDEQSGVNSGGWGGYDDDGFGRPNTSGFGAADDDEMMGYQNLQNQIQKRQDNMLKSTNKSLKLMTEAEEAGNETAHVRIQNRKGLILSCSHVLLLFNVYNDKFCKLSLICKLSLFIHFIQVCLNSVVHFDAIMSYEM